MDYTLQGATADRKPPALPIKQRRSHSSSTSSAPDLQLEETLNQPGSSPLPSPAIDVFAESTDCNAAQCPIHHHTGNSGSHQERFFSDQTPPPIPKKRLARTYSLPAGNLVTSAPPIMSRQLCKYPGEDKKEDSLRSQLTFDTPDQHVPGFFSSFCHQEQVYMSIQNRYLQFMRNTVKHLEAQVLLEEQEAVRVRTLQPQDFVLCKDVQSEKTEEDIFFMVNVSKVPEGLFFAKINTKATGSTCSMPLLRHLNIEEPMAHFSPCIDQEKLSELLTVTEASNLSHEGSAEPWQESDASSRKHTVLSFLERGLAVTIVRDFPWGTLEDFVQEGTALRPEVYERRLCLLILQLALGLQHLESHNVKHAELRPQNVMLVWLHVKNKRSMGKTEADGDPKEGNKNRLRINREMDKPEWESIVPDNVPQENRSEKRLQALWGKWGAPRVVITPTYVQAGPSQEVPTNGLQLGRLLKHCLQEYTDAHQNTQYTSGLLHLINHLTRENPELHMAEIAGVLQALLWGPRAGLFEKNQPNTTVLHNWLMVKRSLLVLKLAEKGLSLNQSGSDWEDYFCLHYLSSADPETVLKTTAQLGLYNNVRLV